MLNTIFFVALLFIEEEKKGGCLKMELVLFILGFVIGVLVCYTVSNIK